MCILYHLGTTHSPTGVLVSHRLGDILIDVGHFPDALTALEIGRDMASAIGCADTREAAELMYSIGVAREKDSHNQRWGNFKGPRLDDDHGAHQAFEEAKQIFLKLGMTSAEFDRDHVGRQQLRGVARIDIKNPKAIAEAQEAALEAARLILPLREVHSSSFVSFDFDEDDPPRA